MKAPSIAHFATVPRVAPVVSDEALLRAWAAGDAAAGEGLLERHFAGVYSFFRTKVDQDLARDLAQRTLLGCVEARHRLASAPTFKAYLFGIARNQLLRHVRKLSRQAKVLSPNAEAHDAGVSMSSHLARRSEQRTLVKALRRLPLDFQLTLELYYWEGMMGEEIAAVLDVAPGTVRSRLTRAKQMVREEIRKLELEPSRERSTIEHLDSWVRRLQSERKDQGAGDTAE